MSASILEKRLLAAAKKLEGTAEAIEGLRASTTLPPQALDEFEGYQRFASHLRDAARLLKAREHAREGLVALRNCETAEVDFLGAAIPFSVARLLAFQSYLSATWAVCDLAARATGALSCNRASIRDRHNPAKLWQHFVREGDAWGDHASGLMRTGYGWPIALSYLIRNHFMHDGAVLNGVDFFEGESVEHKFRVSDEGWKPVQTKLGKESSVQSRFSRLEQDPAQSRDDLLVLLEACHGELDDALGVIVMACVDNAVNQAKLLAERDRVMG